MYTHRQEKLINRLAGGLSLVAAGVAGLALWSWGAGVSDLFTSGSHHVPMAPSTGLLFVLAGSAVFSRTQWPGQLTVTRGCRAVAMAMVIAGTLVCARAWPDSASSVEAWVAQMANTHENSLAGRMSPVTGLAFAAMGAALLLSLLRNQGRLSRSVSWVLMVGVGMLGAGVMASYSRSETWLNGSGLIPMAFVTALSFSLLSLAMCCNNFAAAQRWRATPATPDDAVEGAPGEVQALASVMAFLLAACAIGTLSALYVRRMESQDRKDARDLLKAVGRLKAAELANWRDQRLSDAQFVSEASFVGRDVQAFLSNPTSEQARSEVLHWLTLLKSGDRFQMVALLDTNCVPRVVVSEDSTRPVVVPRDLSAAALQAKQAFISELHPGAGKDEIDLDILFPVFAPGRVSGGPAAKPSHFAVSAGNPGDTHARVPLGIVLLRLDPHQFLYPLLKTWPTPSRSAETGLFRRDGDSLVFLNELRRVTNAALTLRLPLKANSQLPAVKAVLGQRGVIEGTDYCGMPVLVSVHPIPGCTWFLAVKIDQDEIYGPLRRQAVQALSLTALLAAVAGLVTWLIWKYREAGATRRELATERERLVLAQRLEHILRQASDAIILGDEEGRVLEANDRALETYGHSLAEFQSLRMKDMRAPQARDAFKRQWEEIDARGEALFETLHQRKDGSVFPVEVSCRVIEIDGTRYKLEFIRNITELRARQKELERLTRLYATLSALNRSLVRARSREEVFESACAATVRHAGFKLAWIGCIDPETQQVRPVARNGESMEFLERIRVYADERSEGNGPIGQCIRSNRPYICSDAYADPCTAPWREAAAPYGIKAVAALPLSVDGKVIGAFTVYANEPGVFRDKEVALLEEMAMDISYALHHLEQEQKRAEAERALTESEQELRTILRTTKDGFWMLDTHGHFLEVNDAACGLFGLSREELLKLRIHDVEANESEAEVAVHFERIRSRGWDQFETRLRRKDGQSFDAELSVMALESGDACVVAFCRDISSRKQVEAALRERLALQEQLASISATVPGVIYSFRLRPDGTLSMPYASAALQQLYGLRPEEVREDAAPALALVHPDDLARVKAGIADSAQNLTPWRAEFRVRTARFGDVWLEGHSVPSREADDSVLWHGFIWDITARKRAEAEREATVRLLRLANSPSSLCELLAEATGLLRDWSGCEAVGIRMKNGVDFPYCETRGFPAEFVQAESRLCRRDANGQTVCDGEGNPLLDCMCGNVLCGRFDPAKPFFTPRGSFWSNCTTELLASTTEPERQARTRNRCNGEGYESVALIPVRTGATVHGLLQLNDKRKGQFSEHKIAFLEQLADNLANAIAHRQAEEAMRESEERFRQLAENIECVFWMTDADLSKMLYISPAYEHIWGRTCASLYERPKSFLESVHPEDRASMVSHVERLHQGVGGEFEIEYRVVWPDQSVRWIRDRGFPIRDASGRLVRVVGIAEDISERKHVEAALRASEQRYRAVFDGGSDAIFVRELAPEGKSGRFVEANKLACRRLGYTRKELLEKTLPEIDPCMCPERMQSWDHQLRTGGNAFLQSEHVTKDGRRIPVEITGRLLEWEGKSFVVTIARDLTERRAAEAALRESERRFRDMMENVQMVTVILDEQNRILFCNDYVLKLTGWQREEVMGRDYIEVFVPPKEREHMKRVAASLHSGTPVPHYENEIITRKGERRLIAWNNTSLKDMNGRIIGIATIGEDVTDRIRLEAQLRQAQKMEAIGQLAGGVAHDFNNILAATMLNLELLQTDASLGAETQETLKELMTQAERATGLTRQLLLFSRRSVMQVQALDVNEVVENLLKMLRRLIGEHINLEWRGKSQLPAVMADAGMLEQVMMNLVVNARDAMAKGGQLTLATDTVKLGPEQIPQRSSARPGHFVCLSVSDNGCGMDETVQRRLFEPFFTTKEPGKGTGLGLATVYGIVSQHQGCITVESQVGKGTTFNVFLPVTDKPLKGVLSSQQREKAPGGTETILLVEDDAAVRKTTRAVLRRWGYQVLEAENGVEALSVWHGHQERVDLLFTDMVMPAGVSGLELAQRLRAAKPDLKVLISSGYSAELLQHGAAALEGVQYVPKPCPPVDLAAIVRTCLDSPTAAAKG